MCSCIHRFTIHSFISKGVGRFEYRFNLYIYTYICKYPIDVSKVAGINKHYDYNNSTQPIETDIPVVDINSTPLKINSSVYQFTLENMYMLNINGYHIINDMYSINLFITN